MTCFSKTMTTLGGAALIATAMTAYGQAVPDATDSFSLFSEVGEWKIYLNATRGTCLAERVATDAVMQMGLTEAAEFGYLGIFTVTPVGAEAGATPDIAIEVGGKLYAGEVSQMAGNLRDGFSGGYVVTNDASLIQAIADQPSMIVLVSGRDPVTVDLTGTMAAMEAGRECNAAQGG